MNTDLPETSPLDGAIPAEDARLALAALLADAEFRATERNRRFLQFVSDETLEGRSATIKAYSIAVDVLGRSESFDPSTDPIVRIEATRLRASLSRYYEQDRRGCGIRIDLPKGGYVPTFSRMCLGRDDAAPPPEAEPQSDAEPGSGAVAEPKPTIGAQGNPLRAWPKSAWIGGGIALCVVMVAATAAYLFLSGQQPTSFSLKPVVSLAVAAADPALATQADTLRDAMQVALSQFQSVRIATANLPDGVSGVEGRQATYRIEIKYAATSFDRGAWWQLVDGSSGEALQSGVERVFVNARTPGEIETKLAGALAVELVGSHGAVPTAELSSELTDPTLGQGCVLRAAMAVSGGEKEALSESRGCLERSLYLRPKDPDAQSALAEVLLKIDPPEAPTELGPRALLLAADAVRLNPFSDRASAALMVARFRNGQVEAALMAGRRAMELNPNNGAIPAKLGLMLFRMGQWDEALRMAAWSQEIDAAAYPEADLTRAMNAYREGDYRDALLLVDRIGDETCFCANVLRVAALGQLGRAEEARAATTRLKRNRPDFERNYRLAMTTRHFDAAITDGLQAGLVKAGIAVQ